MTSADVAFAVDACHHRTDDASSDTGALLALAGIATEYFAAMDEWDALSYDDTELRGATARLERADRELRLALGLPTRPTRHSAPMSEALPADAAIDSQRNDQGVGE